MAWEMWQQTAAQMKHEEQQLRRAVMRMVQRAMAQGFGAWREMAAQAKSELLAIRRAVLRLVMSSMALAFSSWREKAWDMRQQEERLRNGLSAMLNRALFMGFATWRVNCTMNAEIGLIENEAMLRAMQYLKHGAMAHGFHDWVGERQDAIVRRVRAARALELMDEFRIEQYFLRWLNVIDDEKWRDRVLGAPLLAAREEISKLTQKLASIDRKDEELKSTNGKLDGLTNKISDLLAEMEKLRADNASLKAQLEGKIPSRSVSPARSLSPGNNARDSSPGRRVNKPMVNSMLSRAQNANFGAYAHTQGLAKSPRDRSPRSPRSNN